MLFAVIGTALSALALAVLLFIVGKIGFHTSLPFVDCFMFGSLIAAVDPIATLGIFKVSVSFISLSACPFPILSICWYLANLCLMMQYPSLSSEQLLLQLLLLEYGLLLSP